MPVTHPGRTRLADIAAHAGVSTATVSRVLNGKNSVASETRQVVLAALDTLGYERPVGASQRGAGLVGLVVPELTNPVFPAIAQAVQTQLAQAGYTLLLCTQSPGGTTEDEYIATLSSHEVDGIVFASGLHADTTSSLDRYVRLRDRGTPIVLAGGHAPAVDAPQVSVDEAAATGLAVRHLAALGHTRIGLVVGPLRFMPSQRKLAGFVDAMVAEGLAATIDDARQHVVTTFYTVEGGQAAASELIDSGYTALVCASDLMALGAMRSVRSHGMSVPRDVSIVGYDDSPLMSFTDPPLTTLRQPVQSLARIAVAMLLAEIRGEPATRSEMLVDPELVVRGSTGAVPPTAPQPVSEGES